MEYRDIEVGASLSPAAVKVQMLLMEETMICEGKLIQQMV